MISKIVRGAACLKELASNPKSFSNGPDLHGGLTPCDLDLSGTNLALAPLIKPGSE
jgi:hypothetical protein